ncbi:MAG: SH3 domain-containing protein [Thermomicrobiales bacterium]|nr:SH3 domain-containing protein [Thermomicrobiales bacterium]
MRRMVDQTGLNERLEQYSHRSGMMVGVSMALVVALTIGAFIWVFFKIDPFFTDFTGRTGATYPTPAIVRVLASPPGSAAAASPGTATAASAPVIPTPTALGTPVASGAATPAFTPTHVIADYGQQVNLRAGPSTSSSQIALLAPGTKLKFLNEQQTVGETIWMRFQTERGDVGWVRQIDTNPVP